ncbi:MAG: fido (protein-threonine AMPylation protein) [Candidatus Azotimanducaceae bacterium]|jgi:fido (protein-threonine AMPylation protein)
MQPKPAGSSALIKYIDLFAIRVVNYTVEINAIYPFREGNGDVN